MADDDPGWSAFTAGVRNGDPAALHALYARYGSSLERVATRAIAPSMLRRFGPESVVQSVCRTLVRRAQGGEVNLPDADSLWRLLCAIALNKVRERVRFHRRERRDVNRETREDPASALDGAPLAEPGPDEAAAFRDQVAHVVSTLDDDERRVLELRLAGLTEERAAEEMACSERTVRRVLRRLEAKLTAAFGA